VHKIIFPEITGKHGFKETAKSTKPDSRPCMCISTPVQVHCLLKDYHRTWHATLRQHCKWRHLFIGQVQIKMICKLRHWAYSWCCSNHISINSSYYNYKSKREKLGIDDIISVLQPNRLWWYGHVLQKEDNDWVKNCMEYAVQGPRPRGRPKRTQREAVC